MSLVERVRGGVIWRANGMRATVRSVWRLRGWDPAQRVEFAVPDPSRVAVIFCTWRRLDRLHRTLVMLADQTVPVQAMIWDNSGQPEIVAESVAEAGIPVAVHHSARNIGGFGRFYLARAAAEGGHDTVVFVDDDQEFGPTLVADLISAHRPRSLSGWWAFTDFESITRATPGHPAIYVGMGGMVADSNVFTMPRLFTCPRRYWYLEDRWLSYVAASEGYKLYRSPATLVEVHDGQNQSLSLGRLKRCFSMRYSTAEPHGRS